MRLFVFFQTKLLNEFNSIDQSILHLFRQKIV